MKSILCVLFFSVVTALAQDYGAFIAQDDGSGTNAVLVSSYKLANAPALSTDAMADMGTAQLYRVVVNSNDYVRGWALLDPAVKAAALSAANDQRNDVLARQGADMLAIVQGLLAKINALEDNAGLPQTTMADLSTATTTAAINIKNGTVIKGGGGNVIKVKVPSKSSVTNSPAGLKSVKAK